MYHKILLPTDGSKYSIRASEHAIWIADSSGADIIVLNVIDTNYLKSLPQEDLRLELDKNLREEGKNALDSFSKMLVDTQCEGRCQNVKLTSEIKEGHPADVILKTIDQENIDLVVMGASGRTGLNKFLLGSVTEKVVRTAKCPVLIIH